MSADSKSPVVVPCQAFVSPALHPPLASSLSLSSCDDDGSKEAPVSNIFITSGSPGPSDIPAVPPNPPETCTEVFQSSSDADEDVSDDELLDRRASFPQQPPCTPCSELGLGTRRTTFMNQRVFSLPNYTTSSQSFCAPKNRSNPPRRQGVTEPGRMELVYCNALAVRQMTPQSSNDTPEGRCRSKGLKPRPYSLKLRSASHIAFSAHRKRASVGLYRAQVFREQPESVRKVDTLCTCSQESNKDATQFQVPTSRGHCHSDLDLRSTGHVSDARSSRSSMCNLIVCGLKLSVRSPDGKRPNVAVSAQTFNQPSICQSDITVEGKEDNTMLEYRQSLDISRQGNLVDDLSSNPLDDQEKYMPVLSNAEKHIACCHEASRASGCSSVSNEASARRGERCSSASCFYKTSRKCDVSNSASYRGGSTREPFWEICAACRRSALEKVDKYEIYSDPVDSKTSASRRDYNPTRLSSSCSKKIHVLLKGQRVKMANCPVTSRRKKRDFVNYLSFDPCYISDRNGFAHNVSSNQKNTLNIRPQSLDRHHTTSVVNWQKNNNTTKNISHSSAFYGCPENMEGSGILAVKKPSILSDSYSFRENVADTKRPSVIEIPAPCSLRLDCDSFRASSNMPSTKHIKSSTLTTPDGHDTSRDYNRHLNKEATAQDLRTPQTRIKFRRAKTAAEPRSKNYRTVYSSALIYKQCELQGLNQEPQNHKTNQKQMVLKRGTNSIPHEVFYKVDISGNPEESEKVDISDSPKKPQVSCLSLAPEQLYNKDQLDKDKDSVEKFKELECFPDTEKHRYKLTSEISRPAALSEETNTCCTAGTESDVSRTISFENSRKTFTYQPSTVCEGSQSNSCTSWENDASLSVIEKLRHMTLNQAKSRGADEDGKAKPDTVEYNAEYPDAFMIQGRRTTLSAKTTSGLKTESMNRTLRHSAEAKSHLSDSTKNSRIHCSVPHTNYSICKSCAKEKRGTQILEQSRNGTVYFLDTNKQGSPHLHNGTQPYISVADHQQLHNYCSAEAYVSGRFSVSSEATNKAHALNRKADRYRAYDDESISNADNKILYYLGNEANDLKRNCMQYNYAADKNSLYAQDRKEAVIEHKLTNGLSYKAGDPGKNRFEAANKHSKGIRIKSKAANLHTIDNQPGHKTVVDVLYRGMGRSSKCVKSSSRSTTSSSSEENEDDSEEFEEESDDIVEDEKSSDDNMKRPVEQPVEPTKPLSAAMMREYCRQLRKMGCRPVTLTLTKAILRWNHNYDRFSRVNHSEGSSGL